MLCGRGLHRFLLPLIVIALLLPSRVATTIARTAAREHCEAMSQDCGAQMLKAWCCRGDESTPVNPASVPTTAAKTQGREVSSTPLPAFLASLTAVGDLAHPTLLDHPPPHGYRSVDISLLLSVFLI